MEKLKESNKDFGFFYPSDYFNKRSTCTNRSTTLNLVHMFSKYIFAKSKKTVTHKNGSYELEISHVFYYSEPTLDELKFMRQLTKRYQLEDCDEICIHLYGDKSKYRNSMEEFKRNVTDEYKKNQKDTEIKFEVMEVYNEIPIGIIKEDE